MCLPSGPPYGIPISDDVHAQYSEDVKVAWHTFHDWWTEIDKPFSRSDMPEEVAQAMELILETPIPGYEETGATGKDSCYFVGVLAQMTD